MKDYLKALEERRKILLEITKHLRAEQYNLIPPGYNNNIIWNMGHMLIVSESYFYKNSPWLVPVYKFEIALFKRGTTPEQMFSMYGISLVREALLETVSIYKKKCLVGNSIPVINEASLQFILFHEDIHYRTIEKMLNHV